MTIVIKKPMPKQSDLQTMICKIRGFAPKKRWSVIYSTNKEDRLSEEIFADTYTDAYLEFLKLHGHENYVVDILDLQVGG